jgi:hypothetical protein
MLEFADNGTHELMTLAEVQPWRALAANCLTYALVDFVCLPETADLYRKAERLFCSDGGEDLMEALGYDPILFRDMAIQRQDEFNALIQAGDEEKFRNWWREHFGGFLKIIYAWRAAQGQEDETEGEDDE